MRPLSTRGGTRLVRLVRGGGRGGGGGGGAALQRPPVVRQRVGAGRCVERVKCVRGGGGEERPWPGMQCTRGASRRVCRRAPPPRACRPRAATHATRSHARHVHSDIFTSSLPARCPASAPRGHICCGDAGPAEALLRGGGARKRGGPPELRGAVDGALLGVERDAQVLAAARLLVEQLLQDAFGISNNNGARTIFPCTAMQ